MIKSGAEHCAAFCEIYYEISIYSVGVDAYIDPKNLCKRADVGIGPYNA